VAEAGVRDGEDWVGWAGCASVGLASGVVVTGAESLVCERSEILGSLLTSDCVRLKIVDDPDEVEDTGEVTGVVVGVDSKFRLLSCESDFLTGGKAVRRVAFSDITKS
jgi:hypothetical protein